MRQRAVVAAVMVAAALMCIALTSAAAAFALRQPDVERLDADTSSRLHADYSADPRGMLFAPLRPGIVVAAQDDGSRLDATPAPQATAQQVDIVRLPTATATPTQEPADTPTAQPTATPSRSTPTPAAVTPVTGTATFEPTPPGAGTATAQPEPTEPAATAVPADTPTFPPKPTDTAVPLDTPTPVATDTPEPKATPTLPVVVAPTRTATRVPTLTPTRTAVPATSVPPTATFTPLPTATFTSMPTATFTPAPTATSTAAPTATSTPTPTFTPVPTATFTPTPTPTASPTITPTPTTALTPTPTSTSPAGIVNTGFHGCSGNAADTGGDGDGYETNPANACADDGVLALDQLSGTGLFSSCGSADADRHRFFDYGFNIPGGVTIRGITVQIDASAVGLGLNPAICVELSWDGGTTWTSAQATSSLGPGASTHNVGGPTDAWGRSWGPAEFGNGLFVVRLSDTSSGVNPEFQLDWVAVQVTYAP